MAEIPETLLQGIIDQENLIVDPSVLEVVNARLIQIVQGAPGLTPDQIRSLAARLLRIGTSRPDILNEAQFVQGLPQFGLEMARMGSSTSLDSLLRTMGVGS